jgi:glycosyltransferase involved in cell wall biosynthesis
LAEGLSNALLEAMAVGLPVVVSDVPGNTDVVEHERTGLIFEVRDVSSLAASLARLLDDPELRARLGEAARESVEGSYSLGVVAGRYIELYEELLGLEGGDRTDGAASGETAGE